MYDIFWDSSNATSNLADPSVNPHLGRDDETPTCDDEDFEDDITLHTGPHLGDKRLRTSNRMQNKWNRGKGKISYEDSITGRANAYIARHELIVT